MKLSVITINYNNAEGLAKTMDSVFRQRFSDFEYIVIDGGSTDGSKDLIVNNQDKIAYWCSEKDSGIYNAMNKGIREASGEYLLFILFCRAKTLFTGICFLYTAMERRICLYTRMS